MSVQYACVKRYNVRRLLSPLPLPREKREKTIFVAAITIADQFSRDDIVRHRRAFLSRRMRIYFRLGHSSSKTSRNNFSGANELPCMSEKREIWVNWTPDVKLAQHFESMIDVRVAGARCLAVTDRDTRGPRDLRGIIQL